MQCGQFRSYQINLIGDVTEMVRRRDWELRGVIETGIEERSLPVHLQIRDKRIPIRHGAPARPRVEVNASETKRRRNQRRTRNIRSRDSTITYLLRVESLAVHKELGVEFSRPPTVKHRTYC